ncbi:sigma-70 family RNA polymerase sigma factor [Tautonia marina]|uniref:sigma-70 family RNA polymerase sigma factor n=1 Tax=Tautonia marina TaxID=2653855 RepID=UPI001261331B|nr:sigma-70 family RNA polymerase sigma factor [Tautonia marina]
MPLFAPQTPPEIRFHQLLREARDGSTEARWLVVQLFRKMMLTIANEEVDQAVQAREAPSDIVQETIVEAQRDLDRFHGMTEKEMRGWLRRVLKRNIQNLHLKYRTIKRDLKRERSIETPTQSHDLSMTDPGPSPSTVLDRRERLQGIDRVIKTLPDHYRQVIELYYRKGFTFAQIGEVMKRSEGAVRQLHARSLHELSKRLK